MDSLRSGTQRSLRGIRVRYYRISRLAKRWKLQKASGSAWENGTSDNRRLGLEKLTQQRYDLDDRYGEVLR